MSLIDDDTIAFGEEDNIKSNKLTHPYVTICHLAFRSAAVAVYLFGNWFSSSFIGRIMVGLRWWNYIDDEGKSHWVFESRKGDTQNRVNAAEARIFWMGLVGISSLWTLFFIVSLLSFNFKWLLLVCIALTLNYANLYGYVKCKFGQNSDNAALGSSISTFTSDLIKRHVFENMASMARAPPSRNVPPTSVV